MHHTEATYICPGCEIERRLDDTHEAPCSVCGLCGDCAPVADGMLGLVQHCADCAPTDDAEE